MRFAKRIEQLPPYLFAEICRKIAEKRAEGVDVITFGIGDPDLPTPPHIIDALVRGGPRPGEPPLPRDRGPAGAAPGHRRLVRAALRRLARPRQGGAARSSARRRASATSPLCFIDPGDVALVPDPGYPVYAVGTMFAGGDCHFLPLREENDFLPDLDAIPGGRGAERAKLLWLNYPNNPTGAVADLDFFERGGRLRPAATTSPSATTAPTARSPSTATGRSASSRPTAPATWASSSTPSPRPTT